MKRNLTLVLTILAVGSLFISPEILFYSDTPLTSKFLVVAYREVASDDGFVMTAYLARRLSARRRTIWKR